MISLKSLIVGSVGAGCVAAAGIGGYLAVRSAATPYAASAPAGDTPTVQVASDQSLSGSPADAPAVGASDGSVRQPVAASRRAPADQQTRPAPTRERSAAPVKAVGPEPADVVAAPIPAATPATADITPVQDQPERPATSEPEQTPVTTTVAVPQFEEVTVRADAVIGIQLTSTISTETAKVEDRVTAKVVRDVSVDGRVLIPAGTTIEGTVASVQRGGKFREQARLGVRFTSMQVGTGHERVPIQTETIYRVGDAPTAKAASKIGASAVVGAIIGGVVGGKKGAAIGTTAGGAAGTAAVMAGDAKEVVLAAGTPLTVRLTAPVTFDIERDR